MNGCNLKISDCLMKGYLYHYTRSVNNTSSIDNLRGAISDCYEEYQVWRGVGYVLPDMTYQSANKI